MPAVEIGGRQLSGRQDPLVLGDERGLVARGGPQRAPGLLERRGRAWDRRRPGSGGRWWCSRRGEARSRRGWHPAGPTPRPGARPSWRSRRRVPPARATRIVSTGSGASRDRCRPPARGSPARAARGPRAGGTTWAPAQRCGDRPGSPGRTGGRRGRRRSSTTERRPDSAPASPKSSPSAAALARTSASPRSASCREAPSTPPASARFRPWTASRTPSSTSRWNDGYDPGRDRRADTGPRVRVDIGGDHPPGDEPAERQVRATGQQGGRAGAVGATSGSRPYQISSV